MNIRKPVLFIFVLLLLLLPAAVYAQDIDKGLDIKPEAFATLFDLNMLTFDKTIPELEFEPVEDMENALTGKILNYLTFMVTLNEDENIRDFFIMASGDGSSKSGMIILEGFCSALAAADSSVPLDTTGPIVISLYNGEIEKHITEISESAIVSTTDLGVWMFVSAPKEN